MTEANRPNPPEDVTDVTVTELPPEAVRTRRWNTAKVAGVRSKLEAAGIEFNDNPTDEWIKETESRLNRMGEAVLAREMKGAVIRLNPSARPMGREQQDKTRKAADAQRRKMERGTVDNGRGQRVHRKYPVTLMIGAGLASAVLLGGLVYGGVSEYQKGAAAAAERREAEAAEVAANQSVTQVDVADPNAVVDATPGDSGPAQVDTSGDPDAAQANGAGGAVPADEVGSAPPSTQGSETQQLSAPPDTAALREQYNQGKRDGAAAGYSSGQQEGYAKGKQEGQQAGVQVGAQQGYQQGQQEGYVKGKQAGQQEGYQAGVQQARAAAPTPVAVTSATPTSVVTLSPPVTGGAATGSAAVTPPAPVQGKLSFTTQTGSSGENAGAPRLSFTAGGMGGASATGSGASGSEGQAGSPTSGAARSGGFTLRTAPDAPTTTAAPSFQLVSAGGQGTPSAASSNGGQMILVPNPAASPADSGVGSAAGQGVQEGQEIRQIGGLSVIMPRGSTGSGAQAQPSAGSAVTGSAATGTAVNAQAQGVTFGPYRPYQTISARLQTATLVLEQSKYNLPVIAVSSDGRKWVGTASVGGAQRVYLAFNQMIDLDQKTVLPVPAAAYDAAGAPGIQGSGQDLAPDLVRNLLRNAATGVRDFAQGQLNASKTTVQPNGNVVVEKAAPNLWTMVGSRALSVFDLPTNTQTFTRATYLPAGTPIVLMVGASEQRSAQ